MAGVGLEGEIPSYLLSSVMYGTESCFGSTLTFHLVSVLIFESMCLVVRKMLVQVGCSEVKFFFLFWREG